MNPKQTARIAIFSLFTLFYSAIFTPFNGMAGANEQPPNQRPPGTTLVTQRDVANQIFAEIRILRDITKDQRTRSRAARSLGNYPFLQVQDALLQMLEIEVQSPTPHSGFIINLAGALKKMADRSLAPTIQRLIEVLESSTEQWADHSLPALHPLLAAATQSAPNKKPLPILPQPIVQPPARDTLIERIQAAVTARKTSAEAANLFLNSLTSYLSDRVATRLAETQINPLTPGLVGRETEAFQTLDILLRIKNRIPVLVGEPGVGKSAVAERIAELLQSGNLPQWAVYQREFPTDTVVVETSGSKLSSLAEHPSPALLAQGMSRFLNAAKSLQIGLEKPIIIFIDNLHTVHPAQLEVLQSFSGSLDSPRIIGASTHQELIRLTSLDRALERSLTPVSILELSTEQTLQVITQGWLRQIEGRYGVQIPEALLPDLIRMASELSPDVARPDAQIKFLQDLAIRVARQNAESVGAGPVIITRELAARFAAEVAGMPIDFSNPRALTEYIDAGRMQILSRVIGQDHLVNQLVDTWQTVLTSNANRAFRSVAILGTTGTGKSYSAELLGQVFLGGSNDRVITIDANAYQLTEALNSLLGAPNGYVSARETKGILPDFLAGRGRQGGVIIINEFEKAHPNLMKRLMEMLDTGTLTAGDGRTYRLRRHMVVLTSNRGANRIFSNEAGAGLSDQEMSLRASRLSESELKQFFVQASANGSPDDPNRLPPEVVNRIDRWSVAKPLIFSEILTIANLRVERFLRETHQEHRIHIQVDPNVIQSAARVAYVPADGSRPVEKKIDDYLSRARALILARGDTTHPDSFKVVSATDAQGATLLRVLQGERELGTLDASAPAQFLALYDPRTLVLLRELEAKIASEVLGQQEAIATVAGAVRARAMRPFDLSPVSIMLLGSTGTGKTETAKALAQHLYGSRERASVLNFGEVQHQHDLARFFSPPPGLQGAFQIGEFEQFLINYPEGGVIIFDEITNMGARLSKPERSALFKSLYGIFEEGRWTNNSGHTYHLSKYTLILTGNEGEHLFQELPNDQMKDNAWNRNRGRNKLERMMVESGIPEAFINRIQAVLLMRPLTGAVKERIAQHWLDRILHQFETTYHIKFEVSPEMVSRIAAAFFPVNRGARGVKEFATREITGFVGDLLMNHMLEVRGATAEQPLRIQLSLDLSLPTRPWRVPQVTPVSAALRATIHLADGTSQNSERAVEPTSLPRQTVESNSRRVAVHESGHALVNLHLNNVSGPLIYLTIQSAGNFGGYAMYDVENGNSVLTLRALLHRMAVSAAGGIAEEAAGLPRDAGWSSDLEHMRNSAMRGLAKYGLLPGLEFLPINDKGEPILTDVPTEVRQRLHDASQIMIDTAISMAREIMSRPEVMIQRDAIVEGLLDTGFIEPTRFLELVGQTRLSESTIQEIEEKVTPAMFKSAICSAYLTRP